MLTLADLIESEKGIRPDRTTPGITEAVVDSRKAIPGSLFIAYKGDNVDGHAFVADAFKHGASMAMIDKAIDPSIPVLDLTKPFGPQTVIPNLPFAVRVEKSQASLVKLASFWRRKFNPACDRDYWQRRKIDHKRIDRRSPFNPVSYLEEPGKFE